MSGGVGVLFEAPVRLLQTLACPIPFDQRRQRRPERIQHGTRELGQRIPRTTGTEDEESPRRIVDVEGDRHGVTNSEEPEEAIVDVVAETDLDHAGSGGSVEECVADVQSAIDVDSGSGGEDIDHLAIETEQRPPIEAKCVVGNGEGELGGGDHRWHRCHIDQPFEPSRSPTLVVGRRRIREDGEHGNDSIASSNRALRQPVHAPGPAHLDLDGLAPGRHEPVEVDVGTVLAIAP